MKKHTQKITPPKGKSSTLQLAKERRHSARRASDQDEARIHLETEKRIREQFHICAKTMGSLAEGIFIINAQRDHFPIIYSNPSFQKMTGYTKEDILGQNYFLFYEADPQIVEEIKNTLRQGRSFYGEVLFSRKNGKKFWNSLRIAPVRDANGATTHYVGVQTDITSLKQRDLTIEEQHEELLHVARVGELAEFVSSFAHEINQPLTAILSYAQAAQRMLSGREPEVREILQYIIDDDRRAAEVISHLRTLLKKSKPIKELFDINALVNETAVLMASDATLKNKVLKTVLAADLPAVRGDRIQLQQVLLNLVNNGLDAMEAGSGSRELLIRTSRKDNDMIVVEVKDSGSGIEAESMDKLFTHFFTSKPNGLGMGLPISRSIIEAHGGQLEAKNNPDRGATFYFTIPAGIREAS